MSDQFPSANRSFSLNPYIIAVVYKWFAITTVIILTMLGIKQASYVLIALTVVYNAVFSFLVLRLQINPGHRLLLLVVDFAICISLISFSGGWTSPYFQYGLSFIILSALFFGFKGAGFSVPLYGIFFYLALYVNGFSLDKIIAAGDLVSLITDYAIFIVIGFGIAFFSKRINDHSLPVFDLDDQGQEENHFAEFSVDEQLEGNFSLSARELEIASLLIDGLGSKEIASRLDISANTVKFHLGNIYRKLNAKNRKEAILRLRRSNLHVEL